MMQLTNTLDANAVTLSLLGNLMVRARSWRRGKTSKASVAASIETTASWLYDGGAPIALVAALRTEAMMVTSGMMVAL